MSSQAERAGSRGPVSTSHYEGGKYHPRRQFRLLHDLVAPDAEITTTSLVSTTYHEQMCELTIPIGTDHTATLIVSLATVVANPDWFEEIPHA